LRSPHASRCRPIIFVAYGLGGIIVAKSLIKASEVAIEDGQRARTAEGIKLSSVGVIFLGSQSDHKLLQLPELQNIAAFEEYLKLELTEFDGLRKNLDILSLVCLDIIHIIFV
jgi:hypothetical protein